MSGDHYNINHGNIPCCGASVGGADVVRTSFSKPGNWAFQSHPLSSGFLNSLPLDHTPKINNYRVTQSTNTTYHSIRFYHQGSFQLNRPLAP